MADAGTPPERPRRPVLVWVIVAYIFLSAAWTLAAAFLLLTGGEGAPASAELAAVRETVGPVDLLFMVVLVVLNLFAAVALFRLKRRAVTLFAAVLGVTLLNQVWLFIFRMELVAAQGPFVGIVGLVLPLLFLYYAYRLERRGILA